MKIFPLSSLLLSVFLSFELSGAGIRPVEEGPIHEAFVSQVSENYVVRSISHEPPLPINERAPERMDQEAAWVPGYWDWDDKWQDFLWVSGFWRKPPPGHEWIPGFWQQYPEGWVRVSGFWSAVEERDLMYIDITPPDQIDEKVQYPPNRDYFWVPGHWEYSFQIKDFYWHPGRWDLLDPYWILVPAHYIWRPEGYVYVPAYWDWPIDDRGHVYSCVLIDPLAREREIYEPSVVVGEIYVLRRLLLFYPDYICFFHHHWHFHPDFWNDFCCAPPWWEWDTWWCYTWHDTWGLWWWYAHPGFPNPWWITLELNNQIPVPLADLLSWFSNILGPSIVLKNGVVSPNQLIDAIAKTTNKVSPILPADPNLLDKIQNAANPVPIDARNILKPGGRRLPLDPRAVTPRLPKPVIGPEVQPERIRPSVLPKKPTRPSQVQPPRVPPPSYQPPPIDRTPPPSYQPPPIDHRPPPTYQPPPRQKPPSWRPRSPRRPYPPHTTPPPQSYPPREIEPPRETYPPQTRPPRRRGRWGKPLPRVRVYPREEVPQTQTPPETQTYPPGGEIQIQRGQQGQGGVQIRLPTDVRIQWNRDQGKSNRKQRGRSRRSNQTQQWGEFE